MRKCTYTGRVVYDRKPHLFGWRDVRRIVRTLEAPKMIDVLVDREERKDFVALLETWSMVNRRVAGYFIIGGNLFSLFSRDGAFGQLKQGLGSTKEIWQRIKELVSQ